LAEPGGICVNRVVRDQVRDKLDFAFEDAGEQRVKNIARPLRVCHVRPGQVAGEEMSAPQPPLALPDKPSLAVLPFTNMSGDPEQEFVSDGIAEDVITALSRHPSLFVIARNSTFTYKGRAVDVKQVGRELGVRYVLEGGVRKAGNRIRVTAQLIEAGTGNHVWAERYDRDLADIFAVQDEITHALTTALTPAIADAELRRAMRKPPESLDAWAAYQRGLWHLSKANPDDDAIAQNFFRHATDLDPTFAPGYSALALAQLQAAGYTRSSVLAKRKARPRHWRAGRSRSMVPMRGLLASGRLRAAGVDGHVRARMSGWMAHAPRVDRRNHPRPAAPSGFFCLGDKTGDKTLPDYA
jgi:adenylate cyclase